MRILDMLRNIFITESNIDQSSQKDPYDGPTMYFVNKDGSTASCPIDSRDPVLAEQQSRQAYNDWKGMSENND